MISSTPPITGSFLALPCAAVITPMTMYASTATDTTAEIMVGMKLRRIGIAPNIIQSTCLAIPSAAAASVSISP